MPACLVGTAVTKHSTTASTAALGTNHLSLETLLVNQQAATAGVYCKGNFAANDGKTADGLVRYCESYRVLSVIDSEKEDLGRGRIQDDKPKNMRICKGHVDALSKSRKVPDNSIFDMTPVDGMLLPHGRGLLLEAMSYGMNIVNDLHQLLNDDPAFIAACESSQVKILDVRMPRAKKIYDCSMGVSAKLPARVLPCQVLSRHGQTYHCRRYNPVSE